MSKKANPAIIGLFVVVAAAVAVAALLILGSGKLFKQTDPYVVFFDGSLAGLDIGAPVEFRGVRVGGVKGIHLDYNRTTRTVTAPVYIELEKGRMKYSGDEGLSHGLVTHIKQGLRAQLQSQSFVTGKLKVMLVEAPGTPIVLVKGDPTVAEIPTIPGMMDSLAMRLEDLPLEEIVINLHTSTQALAEVAESGQLADILADLRISSQALADLAESGQIGAILDDLHVGASALGEVAQSGRLTQIVEELHASMKAIAEIAESGSLTEIVSNLEQALDNINSTLTEGGRLIVRMNQGVTPLRIETSKAMNEIVEAARAARNLMEYLDRHPESLVQGKGEK